MVGTPFKMKRAGSVTRQQLAEMIEAIEFRRASRPQASVPTGWNGTAETLARGVIHEWFGLTEAPGCLELIDPLPAQDTQERGSQGSRLPT